MISVTANILPWIWLSLMIVFFVIEACTFSLTTIWAAIACLSMIFISKTGLALHWQLLIFTLITLVLVFLTRPLALKKLKTGKESRTNVNVLEGEEVLVVKEISKFNKGEVKAKNGVIWTAKSLDDKEIAVNSTCTVSAVEGNTLIIVKTK